VIGWSRCPTAPIESSTPLRPAGQTVLNGWVKVSADNTVTVIMSQAEMGRVLIPTCDAVGDEMDAD